MAAVEAAVTVRTWNEASQMEAERLFVDTVVGNAYSRSRGALNRRAEIRVVKPGECGAS